MSSTLLTNDDPVAQANVVFSSKYVKYYEAVNVNGCTKAKCRQCNKLVVWGQGVQLPGENFRPPYKDPKSVTGNIRHIKH